MVIILIKKEELFKYFEEISGENYYFALHGIADNADLKNQYSDMSKEEKAQNMLNIGIINARHRTTALTCKIFGNLSETYIREKDAIIDFNNYSFYSKSGNQLIVVLSIPIVFEESTGKKIWGGWGKYTKPNETQDFGENAKCISDYSFSRLGFNIPSEVILGYYSYHDGDSVVEFTENPKHYSKLSQKEKDEFIHKYFQEPRIVLDTNNSSNFEIPSIIPPMLRTKCISQLQEFFSPEYQKMLHEATKYATNSKTYSLEELETTPLQDIDITRIKPNLSFMLSQKIGIRSQLIFSSVPNEKRNTLMNAVGIPVRISGFAPQNLNDNYYEEKVSEFEQKIKDAGNDVNNLYQYWYARNYKHFDKLFIDKIRELKISATHSNTQTHHSKEDLIAIIKSKSQELSQLEHEETVISDAEELIEKHDNTNQHDI